MSEEREQYGIGGRLVAADQLPSRIQAALALLKRVESGESVEIRKRDGEWPNVHVYPDGMAVVGRYGVKDGFAGKDVPEAAEKWNGGEG
jgi:hypothetical protein